MKKITILGSTGSVGLNALSIIKNYPDLFSIEALVAKCNINLIKKQCKIFRPKYVVMSNKYFAEKLIVQLKDINIYSVEVLYGKKSMCDIASLSDVSIVISAIVGSAGLLPTLAAIDNNKTILLANKEALIICGNLFIEKIKRSKARIFPIDSEHNAIFQILSMSVQKNLIQSNLKKEGIKKIILTGSGGPFINLPISDLKKITPQQACKHPNWFMGKKISIDSATMINKGFEYIEAHWLFNIYKKIKIEIIIHPQSIIHSMVEYIDGSILAQLSNPDMRIPISYAMFWPHRKKSNILSINFSNLKELTFFAPDFKRYPCLKLAIEAYKNGQSSIIILNASNEVAVSSFLKKEISFTDISKVNTFMLEKYDYKKISLNNVENILEIDKEIRFLTKKFISQLF